MTRATVLILFLSACAASAQVTSTIFPPVPDNRVIDWKNFFSHNWIGLPSPGTIPTRSMFVDLTSPTMPDGKTTNPYRCAHNGTTDDAPKITAAIKACPPNQYVYAKGGTYANPTIYGIGSGKIVIQPKYSNWTFRGDGPGLTILRTIAPRGSIVVGARDALNPATNGTAITTKNLTTGATTMTVADGTKLTNGRIMQISPGTAPTWEHHMNKRPWKLTNSDSPSTTRFMFLITNIAGNTVTFTPPIPTTMTTTFGQCFAQSEVSLPVKGVGFENFTFDCNGLITFPFELSNMYGSWFHNLEVTKTLGHLLWANVLVNCELSHIYGHDVLYLNGNISEHEGIDLVGSSSFNYVYDNYVTGAYPGVAIGDGADLQNAGGASCNIVAYNYTRVPAVTPQTQGADWGIIAGHGPHCMFDLAEGNVSDSYLGDPYYGSTSHQTLFRNWFMRKTSVKHLQNYYNFVGNILGNSGVNFQGYQAPYTNRYLSSLPAGVARQTSHIWEFGFGDYGSDFYGTWKAQTDKPDYTFMSRENHGRQPLTTAETSAGIRASSWSLDMNVEQFILRFGNYDYVTKSQTWDDGATYNSVPIPMGKVSYTKTPAPLPNSFYLNARPAWFGDDTTDLPWPPFTPESMTAFNTQTQNQRVSRIPAGYRATFNKEVPNGGGVSTPHPRQLRRPHRQPSSPP